MRIYREDDLASNLVMDRRVAVLGYGNQGHAHAQNLRDSGAQVAVGTRRGGNGWRQAAADGFEPLEIGEATADADFVVMLFPDEVQGDVFDKDVRSHLAPDATLVFAHGFAIAFDVVKPPENHDVVLVAPKGQGHFLRSAYQKGHGVLCLMGVETDASGKAFEKALSYASLLGCLRTGAIKTTFREEAVTDLFGEQAVLCGGVPALVKAAYRVLVERGYSSEVAYIECLHELKIITDLLYKGGISYMRDRISRTAAWGSFETEDHLIDDAVGEKLRTILDAIESGEFANSWQKETVSGQNKLRERIREEQNDPIENAGRDVRDLMPYLKEEES